MLKHLKSALASLLAAALLVSALTIPAFAANTGAAKDVSFNHDLEQVQDIEVINRELHTSYAVANRNDRTAIISSLNALTVAPMKAERGEEDGLRLLTVLMKNGDRFNYWCYADKVVQGEDWQASGKHLDTLYAAMTRCQQNYPANVEWLGYMNPYRVTKMELSGPVFDGCILSAEKSTYETAASEEQRAKILDVCDKLKDIKVGTVQRFNGNEMEKASPHRDYHVTLTFEDNKEVYEIQVTDGLPDGQGKIWISVSSIGYDLCYTTNDAALFKSLTDALAALY